MSEQKLLWADAPDENRLLLRSEEERMHEHAEAMFKRLETYLRSKFHDVCMTKEECAVTGSIGNEEVFIRCDVAYRDDDGLIEAFADIQIGAITQDGGEGYFSAVTPEDTEFEDLPLVGPSKYQLELF